VKLLGKRNVLLNCNLAILIGIWIMNSFASVSAYNLTKATPNEYKYSLSPQILLAVGDNFTRKALLESKLQKYIIQKGDTLFQISSDCFVSVKFLQSINKIKDPRGLIVGQALYIPPVENSSTALQNYSIKQRDSIRSIQSKYQLTEWQFRRLNPQLYGSLKMGEVIRLPKRIIVDKVRGDNHFLIQPVRGLLTSRFGFRWGKMHYGIDLAAPAGTPVKAADNGYISFTGWLGGYGLLVIIDHGSYKTYYGHLSKIIATKGSQVHQGDLIGRVGATGHAYGNHLHFEVERKGVKQNPYYFLKKFN
jgi:murein DD-endopeptidase MepM/ murein hydrolase activator NlpD